MAGQIKMTGDNMLKRWVYGLLALTVLILGCSKKSQDEQVVKVPVEVQTIATGNLVQNLTYNGDINAEFEVKVFSKIPDRIERFNVDMGSYVTQGQPIARIVATTIEQAVRQAEAGLAAARAQEANVKVEYERAQRLQRENAISKQQYDLVVTQYEAAKAGLETAEAALHSAKSTLDDATVTAPITGIIGKRFYEAGDMANPAVPLVTIVQMNRVKILFDATETDLGKIKLGQVAAIVVRSFPDETFSGRINKISPVLDPYTRLAQIEVIMDNPGHKLKPGMYAQVTVTTGVLQNVILVPRFSIIESTTLAKINGEDQPVTNYFTFIVQDGKAIQRQLQPLYINHVQMAVSEGVRAGDQLIVSGQANVRDGSFVDVIKK
jgi:RND family efflux transporter MFP subunit